MFELSTLTAGSRVNTLIDRQDTAHVVHTTQFLRRKSTPYVAGHTTAAMYITLYISR